MFEKFLETGSVQNIINGTCFPSFYSTGIFLLCMREGLCLSFSLFLYSSFMEIEMRMAILYKKL